MRELKFRAWDGKKMHLPEYSDKEDFHILPNGEVVYTTEYGYERHELNRGPEWIIMQYTGIKDRKGIDIFEGDVCLFADTHNFYVVFEEGQYICYHAKKEWGRWGSLPRINDHDLSQYSFHVIGNIYQNGDLIQG